jgi:hypothetical protein
MMYHPESGVVWFGADSGTIGKAVVSPDENLSVD